MKKIILIFFVLIIFKTSIYGQLDVKSNVITFEDEIKYSRKTYNSMYKSTENGTLIWIKDKDDKLYFQNSKDSIPYKSVNDVVVCFDVFNKKSVIYINKKNKIYIIKDIHKQGIQKTELKLNISDTIIDIANNTDFYIFISEKKYVIVDKATLSIVKELNYQRSNVGFFEKSYNSVFGFNDNYLAYIYDETIKIYSFSKKKIINSFKPEIDEDKIENLKSYDIDNLPSRYIDNFLFVNEETLLVSIICFQDLQFYNFKKADLLKEITIMMQFKWAVDEVNMLLLDKYLIVNRGSAGMYPHDRIMAIYDIDELLKNPIAIPICEYRSFTSYDPDWNVTEVIDDRNLMPLTSEIIRVNNNTFIINGQSKRERDYEQEKRGFNDYLTIEISKK